MEAKTAKFFKAMAIVSLFTVPIFRSGGRTNLTAFGWLVNHMIFGPPVEYVPEEDYMCELQGAKILSPNIHDAQRFFKISEDSARQLVMHERGDIA